MCVTRGLLSHSDEEIKATLGHEFGHLAHKDTDRVLVVGVGNTIITIIFMIIQIGIIIANVLVAIASVFSRHGFLISIFNALVTFLSLIVLRGTDEAVDSFRRGSLHEDQPWKRIPGR